MRLGKRIAAAAWLCIAAQTAHAQLPPQIEIDFLSVVTANQVPLSPVLTLLIALALAAIGVAVLRRRTHGGRWLGALLLGLAVAASWPAVQRTALISDAAAISGFSLTASPGLFNIVSPGSYLAINQSGGAITITQVKLNNPGGLSITGGTCVAGLVLQQNQSCTVVVS